MNNVGTTDLLYIAMIIAEVTGRPPEREKKTPTDKRLEGEKDKERLGGAWCARVA